MVEPIKSRAIAALFIFGMTVSSGLSFPDLALAETSEQTILRLQAQIEQMREQISVLQQQLGETKPPRTDVLVPVPIPEFPNEKCPTFTTPLYKGKSDANTGGEVSRLQKILASDSEVYPEKLITGYYGSLTEKAVQRWQVKNGVVSSGSAQTTGFGVVGVKTRTKMSIICPTIPSDPYFPPTKPPLDTDYPIPQEASINVVSPNGGETWTVGSMETIKWQDSRPVSACNNTDPTVQCINSAPRFYDIKLAPYDTSCLALTCSTNVTIPYTIAKSVSSNSYSWSVGKVIDGTGIVTAGPYKVWVCQSGTDVCDLSDYYFKIVTIKDTNLPPVIHGVSGPTQLNVSETGTWSIKASDPENGQLSYSVNWGDLAAMPRLDTGTYEAVPSFSQTSTFSHSYAYAGSYKVVITVRDATGQSAETSITVQIGSVWPPSITVISPNGGESLLFGKTYTIKWKSTASTVMVDLIRPGYECHLTNGDVANTGYLTFTISNCVNGLSIWPADDYKVRVMYRNNAAIVMQDESDTPFSITKDIVQSAITVQSPNGGETWTKRTTQTIKWQDSTLLSSCFETADSTVATCINPAPKLYDLRLVPYYPSCTGPVCPAYLPVAPYTIVKGISGNSYMWGVGNIADLYDRLAPDGSYTIQICQSGTGTCDSSDSYFKVVSENIIY